MSSFSLSWHSREELAHLLKMMKSYRNGLKQIGKRATLIDPKNPPKNRARVEYQSSISVADIEKYANSCIRFAFPDYTGDSPVLEKNDSLKWWARVFVWDDMVDVSFQKFQSLLK